MSEKDSTTVRLILLMLANSLNYISELVLIMITFYFMNFDLVLVMQKKKNFFLGRLNH